MPVRPKKHLGQHFLIDPNVIGKIVEAVGAPTGAAVVEIGPGEGALTGALLARYPDLTAVEVDAEAVAHLHAAHPALDLRHQDVLDVDWAALAAERGGPLWVVGNLPYYLTSPILFGLLDSLPRFSGARAQGPVPGPIRRAVVMMQREVAERIVAEPGTKAYGILSVQTQLFARPRLLFTVSRHVFRPKPEVESAVLGLDFPQEAVGSGGALGVDSAALRRVVRTAFGQRRKMLRGSLAALAGEVGRPLPEAVAERRPETLSPAEFVALTHALYGP